MDFWKGKLAAGCVVDPGSIGNHALVYASLLIFEMTTLREKVIEFVIFLCC